MAFDVAAAIVADATKTQRANRWPLQIDQSNLLDASAPPEARAVRCPLPTKATRAARPLVWPSASGHSPVVSGGRLAAHLTMTLVSNGLMACARFANSIDHHLLLALAGHHTAARRLNEQVR